jgi:hypothetical protein
MLLFLFFGRINDSPFLFLSYIDANYKINFFFWISTWKKINEMDNNQISFSNIYKYWKIYKTI